MYVPVEEPLLMRIVGECPECGFRAAVDCAVRIDQVDGGFKLLTGDFRKSDRDRGVLERQVIDTNAGDVLPAPNPDAAEMTVAIKDHERLCRRRCDLIGSFHLWTNSLAKDGLQVFRASNWCNIDMQS